MTHSEQRALDECLRQYPVLRRVVVEQRPLSDEDLAAIPSDEPAEDVLEVTLTLSPRPPLGASVLELTFRSVVGLNLQPRGDGFASIRVRVEFGDRSWRVWDAQDDTLSFYGEELRWIVRDATGRLAADDAGDSG